MEPVLQSLPTNILTRLRPEHTMKGSDLSVSPKTLSPSPQQKANEQNYFTTTNTTTLSSSNAADDGLLCTNKEKDSTPRTQPELPCRDDGEPRRPSITFAPDPELPARRSSAGTTTSEPPQRRASSASVSLSLLNRRNSCQARGRELDNIVTRIRSDSPPYQRYALD